MIKKYEEWVSAGYQNHAIEQVYIEWNGVKSGCAPWSLVGVI